MNYKELERSISYRRREMKISWDEFVREMRQKTGKGHPLNCTAHELVVLEIHLKNAAKKKLHEAIECLCDDSISHYECIHEVRQAVMDAYRTHSRSAHKSPFHE